MKYNMMILLEIPRLYNFGQKWCHASALSASSSVVHSPSNNATAYDHSLGLTTPLLTKSLQGTNSSPRPRAPQLLSLHSSSALPASVSELSGFQSTTHITASKPGHDGPHSFLSLQVPPLCMHVADFLQLFNYKNKFVSQKHTKGHKVTKQKKTVLQFMIFCLVSTYQCTRCRTNWKKNKSLPMAYYFF